MRISDWSSDVCSSDLFANYGFNKSHAAAYALVSYQTAWLKTHYPAEFMAAVLSCEMQHTDAIVTMRAECLRMGLTMLPPDVNHSQFRFTVPSPHAIRYGLGAITGADQAALEGIIAAPEDRKSAGVGKRVEVRVESGGR